MSNVDTRPFLQRIRIATLRISFVAFIPLIMIVKPMHSEGLFNELLEQGGLLLIIAAVLGRFWSVLYIGGKKNKFVMQSGPYSMCRHPLYFFSTLGVLGFGLMLQSLVLALMMAAVFFAILNITAASEENHLRRAFGPDYDAYARKTPRIIPDITKFRTDDNIMVSLRTLRVNFADALVFICLIPLAEVVEWVRETGALPALLLP